MGQVDACIALQLEPVAPVRERESLTGNGLGRIELSAPSERARADAAPAHLRRAVAGCRELLDATSELLGLVDLSTLEQRPGEVERGPLPADRFSDLVPRFVGPPEVRLGRSRIACLELAQAPNPIHARIEDIGADLVGDRARGGDRRLSVVRPVEENLHHPSPEEDLARHHPVADAFEQLVATTHPVRERDRSMPTVLRQVHEVEGLLPVRARAPSVVCGPLACVLSLACLRVEERDEGEEVPAPGEPELVPLLLEHRRGFHRQLADSLRVRCAAHLLDELTDAGMRDEAPVADLVGGLGRVREHLGRARVFALVLKRLGQVDH